MLGYIVLPDVKLTSFSGGPCQHDMMSIYSQLMIPASKGRNLLEKYKYCNEDRLGQQPSTFLSEVLT
jgi:hypothetical protein